MCHNETIPNWNSDVCSQMHTFDKCFSAIAECEQCAVCHFSIRSKFREGIFYEEMDRPPPRDIHSRRNSPTR